ncbi:molybdenum cofactor guanylyltransferase [Spirulina sp. CCNP1310]|uniref:molybdenum cofactor guanylyltransferase n=1 Tax=Spirulina sp. CCNP1310 TaxID=3110249 RepID=UPI002B201637|nr:molybdenum cofactor guanylyltransferase [Spirulina sp. CCNP1310]MEA5421331.1 molybdenum cofactor guanylyltransferase [Spirulina sp. CCNP1310]
MGAIALVAGLILAGGKSSRMGSDKALKRWQGVPLILRVYEAIAPVVTQVSLLTPWPERYCEILPPACQRLQELEPHQGPAFAIAQGLAQIQAPWLLVVACDLPCLDSGMLIRWREKLADLSPHTQALIPRWGERWEPLCGFYRGDLGPKLGAYLDQGGRSLQGFFNAIEVQALGIEEADLSHFHNCNTPADLEE